MTATIERTATGWSVTHNGAVVRFRLARNVANYCKMMKFRVVN